LPLGVAGPLLNAVTPRPSIMESEEHSDVEASERRPVVVEERRPRKRGVSAHFFCSQFVL